MTISLTGKQRGYLKGLAHNLNPVVQIGKDGLTEQVIKSLDDALEANELIKVQFVFGDEVDKKEDARKVAEAAGAELVQLIGFKFVLYRKNKKKPRIEIPS